MENPTTIPEVSEDERPRVRIEITGTGPHCGKTQIAALIVNALRNAGFDEIMSECMDGDLRQRVLEGFDPSRLIPIPAIDLIDNNGQKIQPAPDQKWQA